jgi:hypothetical protein
MSDQRLRELERRFRATGAPEDEAPLLQERLRRGDLSAARLELAAYLGHEGAALACKAEGIAPPTHVDVGLAHLPAAERDHWRRLTQEVIDDPGRALISGLADLQRPAWSLGLARFGAHVCLRAVVAGSSVLLDCARPGQGSLPEHLQLAADAVRGDPAAKATAARLPLPPHVEFDPMARLQNEVCMTVLGQDPDAPHRLTAALSEVLRRARREEAFQLAARAALVPWTLKLAQA